jgi:hypothetical protein
MCSLVVKPVDGEQGQGVAVDLCASLDVQEAIDAPAPSVTACCWKVSPGYDLPHQ